MRWLAALAVLGACDVVFHLDHVNIDGPSGEAGPIADADCGAVGSGFIRVCAGGSDVSIEGTVSTDSCDVRTFGASQFCLVSGNNVTIGNATPLGALPLVIAARHTLTVDGVLDASSKTASNPGSGSRACSTPPGIALGTGASGGPGGSSHTEGGRGGSNAGDGSVGALTAETANAVLRGGCQGGKGGAAGATGGDGGYGGGAIYLVAGDAIVVASGAKISAAGQGGEGGHMILTAGTGGGGGGGGTGGMIVFDAPVTTTAPSSLIWANGAGGGGGGAKNSLGSNGAASPGPPAHGAGGVPNGGAGATGMSHGADGGAYVMAGANQMPLRSAGGGGGGQGWIFYYGASIGPAATISPPPQAGP